MRSPVTGKPMRRCKRDADINFRGDSFSIVYHYYLDRKTGEEYTDEELETLNLDQVYSKYRIKYSIPFPNKIKSIRKQYGLTQNEMSEIMGFGVNMWRLYENGEIPSVSNARLIELAKNRSNFLLLDRLHYKTHK